MKISNLGLSAFLQTAKDLNITNAAKELGLTQSALSQRISLLEADLEVTLFVREPRGLKLTEAGEKLLKFASIQKQLENELLWDIKGSQENIAGHFRLAAYSSVLRSMIIPSLAGLMRAHPGISIDFQSYEMYELPDVLKSAKADLIVMDYKWGKSGLHESVLGYEEFVVIESVKHQSPADVYLDHGPLDNATESFFKNQSKVPKLIRRSFMGDVYGIIDAVELGLGRAVMSRHLVNDNKYVKIVPGYQKYKRPITIHYHDQPYYSRLHSLILKELEKKAPSFLS
ncbi:LysR family transcriptional regulator [Bdellovibrio reynosensis]|uniref:LysR family transcriptional regulator n=1 Tax=Bdellovibrio reynosensis TaxID=2835041 RepID=A0ABY4CDM3_9BACT|nr:LysR family transcriptional regulator [Bdellovibrio reynosensis]UOF02564.1 LysR family transcriptional regulator [Bdellovibrio reynosensis]